MEISEFLNEDYSDSALYMSYRSLPSFVDGLKNSGRKVVYTIKKSHIKSRMKVSGLGSEVVKTAGYLHGESSIQGTIITRARNYCGSNNLPILDAEGSFGTRFTPEAAAPRYIFTKPAEVFDKVFVPADDVNLEEQHFEGDLIEPMFYVPTVPLLFVNGCEGIGVGFANVILARSLKNMIKAIRLTLEEKKVDKKLFIPSWNGFRGTVKELEPNKYEIRGLAEINKNKVKITELPISWNLSKYIELLKDLKKKDIIKKYIDYSEDDVFSFEVTLSDEEASKSEEEIFVDLGLVETVVENLSCIDTHNAIKDEFKTPLEVFAAYVNVKKKYLDLRHKSETKRLKDEKAWLDEQVKFIREVLKGTIDMKKKKSEVEKELKEKKYASIEKLIAMPLYSQNEDKVKELEAKAKAKSEELKAYMNETWATLWEKDLQALESCLKEQK